MGKKLLFGQENRFSRDTNPAKKGIGALRFEPDLPVPGMETLHFGTRATGKPSPDA
jgi:hypothetical protein